MRNIAQGSWSGDASWKWRQGMWQGIQRNLVQRRQAFINSKPSWSAKRSKLPPVSSSADFNGLWKAGIAVGPELSLNYLLCQIVCKEQPVPSHSAAPQRSKSLERIHLQGCRFWKASLTHLPLWVLHESPLCQSRWKEQAGFYCLVTANTGSWNIKTNRNFVLNN